MENKRLFALDIGTRSVIGLVGEHTGTAIQLLEAQRQEHHTRAMLDGQIHDVPEVANILLEVKNKLEATCGPLTKVSVAAAGRALCTIRACAEIDAQSRGILASSDEHALELAAIQSAQSAAPSRCGAADSRPPAGPARRLWRRPSPRATRSACVGIWRQASPAGNSIRVWIWTSPPPCSSAPCRGW